MGTVAADPCGTRRIEAVRKEDRMLWMIAVVLIIVWMLGLVTGYEMDSFIHGLYVIAVVLLLVSINREVSIYRELGRMVRSRNYRRAKMPAPPEFPGRIQ